MTAIAILLSAYSLRVRGPSLDGGQLRGIAPDAAVMSRWDIRHPSIGTPPITGARSVALIAKDSTSSATTYII